MGRSADSGVLFDVRRYLLLFSGRTCVVSITFYCLTLNLGLN